MGIASVYLNLTSLPARASGAGVGVWAMYGASVALALFAFGYAVRGGTLLFGVVNLTPVFLAAAVLCFAVHLLAVREIRFQLIWADVALIGFAVVMLANSGSAAGLEKGLRFVALVLAPYFVARLILVDFRWVKCFLITALAAVTVIGVGAFAFSVLPDGVARLLPYEIDEWNERLVFLDANSIQLGMLLVVGTMLYVGLISGWRRIWIIPGLAVTGALLYSILIVGTRASLIAIVGALLAAFLISLVTRRFSNSPVLLIALCVTTFMVYTIFASGLVAPPFEIGDAGIMDDTEQKRMGEPISAYLVYDQPHRADDDVIRPWHWQRADPRADAADLPDNSTWSDIDGALSYNYTPTGDDLGKFLRAYVFYQKGYDAYRAQTPAIGPIAAAYDATGIAGIKHEGERVGDLITAYLVHDSLHRADDDPVRSWRWQRATPRADAANLPDDDTWADIRVGGALSYNYTPTGDDLGKFLRGYVYYEKEGDTYRGQTPVVGPIAAASGDAGGSTESNALSVPQTPVVGPIAGASGDAGGSTESNALSVPQPTSASALASATVKIGDATIMLEDEPKRVGDLIIAYLVHDTPHRADDYSSANPWRWERANPRADDANLPDDATWTDIDVGGDRALSYNYAPTGDDLGKFLRGYVYYEKEGDTYRGQTPVVGPIAAASGDAGGSTESNALSVPQPTVAGAEDTVPVISLPQIGITLPNQERFETIALPINPMADNTVLEDNGIQNRVDLISESLNKFKDNPLRGAGTAGMDNYAHNIFLETAAELGLIGIVFLLAFLAFALRSLWKFFIKLEQGNLYFHIITAVFLVVCALFIQKQFSTNLAAHKDLIIFTVIILNLPLLLGMPSRESSGGLRGKVPRRFRFLAPAKDSVPVADD